MKLIYEGTDITNSVEIKKADIHDNAGGVADSINLSFADTQGLWSQWKPQKGESIELQQDSFSSGKMFIRLWKQKPGEFLLQASSIPLSISTNNTRSWENIRFLKLAQDLAQNSGLSLQVYSVTDWNYDWVDQVEERDIKLLSRLCIREGYRLKISDGKAIIYGERDMEQIEPAAIIYKHDMIGAYEFTSSTDKLKSSCIIRYMDMSGSVLQHRQTVQGVSGGTLKINERVGNLGEAERFSKAYLRYVNKFETTGYVTIKLNTRLAAGNTIGVQGVGLADGKYFIEKAIHKILSNKTVLTLRKPLEGY